MVQQARRTDPTDGAHDGNREQTMRCESTWCADHKCKTPSDMLTGPPKRARLRREVHGNAATAATESFGGRRPGRQSRGREARSKSCCQSKKRCGREPEQLNSKVTQQTRQRGSSFQQQYHMNSGTGQSRKPRAASKQFASENVAHGATDSRKQ